MPTVRPLAFVLLAILALALVASVAGFVAVGLDKLAAARGRRRLSERMLHTLEALGGWPGSLAAQRLFRHKTAKQSYRRSFRAMAVAHVLVALILLAGAAALGP